MTVQPKHRFTAEEYLAMERVSEAKHEYIDDEIFDMVGASPRHNLISASIIIALGSQLQNRACFVYTSDQRIQASRKRGYMYPDITILCGEPNYFEGNTLTNPTVIIEVLSPSTELYDLGKKWMHYQRIASLQDCLMIAQDKLEVDHYSRTSETSWLMTQLSGADAVINLPSIGCTLALSDVYHKVTFDDPPPE
jgi:Uma2 family endonuclease